MGDIGTFLTSPDGINWTDHSDILHYGFYFCGIAFGQGQFTAVAQIPWVGGTAIATSPDGVSWTMRFRSGAGDGDAFGVAYGNDTFVVVGDDGAILQSGLFITLTLTPNPDTRQLTLSLTGPTGLLYTIQSSSNLVNWQTVTNFTSIQATNLVLDAILPTGGQMFYRELSPGN